jgi:hypothetical protein
MQTRVLDRLMTMPINITLRERPTKTPATPGHTREQERCGQTTGGRRMTTYADVLTQILHDVTGRPHVDVQALVNGIAEGLGHRSRLQDPMTDAEADAWLTRLRQEKAGILAWLVRGTVRDARMGEEWTC